MDYEALSRLLFPHIDKIDYETIYPPRDLPEGAVVSRLAPSPTGFVHLGNLVQGFTSERLAHQSGGILFLRVEDTDQKREVEGAVESLIKGLSHYDVFFDEGATAEGDYGAYGPYRQRERAAIYHLYAKKLVAEGKAYPCFCTEEELTEIRAKQEAGKENFGYYGSYAVWRDRPIEDIQSELSKSTPWVLRFRADEFTGQKIKFTDLIKGNLEFPENDIDHVLLKSDGIPTYHFAHAVDDHLMRTTHVVRGDEWLPSLPFHIQIHRALGFRLPKYLHIGTLQKMDGGSKRKLSKRKDPELAVSYYMEAGYPVQSVREYLLTFLNSNYEDWRRANPDAPMTDFPFSPKKMNPAGALFDGDKLRDVSKNVIAKMSAETVYELASEWAKSYDTEFYELLTRDPDYSISILRIGRGGTKPRKDLAVWTDLKPYADFFFDELFIRKGDYPDCVLPDLKAILDGFAEVYDPADEQQTWFDKIKLLAKRLGYAPEVKEFKANPGAYKGHVGDVSMALRIAITGRENSPDLHSVMAILGCGRVLSRLREAAE